MSTTSFAAKARKPFVEFLRRLQNHQPVETVANLAYKRHGEFVLNPIEDNFPIEELPMPDLSDFTPASYTLAGKPLTFMITSRSCPHKCSFCSVHTTFGTDYRRRSLEQVLEEIELRYRQGYRVIDFEDDNLTYYKPTFKELCRRLIARFPNREMEFVAMNGISYLSLDDELLELMRQAGFSHLNLALVSSDKTVRETTKRPHTLEAYLRVVHKAAALGFKIVSYQILGLPNESLDSMIQTLAFNARLPVLLGASPFYQTPNSPIARGLELNASDFIKARLTALAIETDHFSRADIYTLFVTTRIVNFLKGLPVDGVTSLPELMRQRWSDPRSQIGFDLLKQLAETQRLYFATSQGLLENKKFGIELFARVLSGIGTIRCQNGATISVEEFARRLAIPQRFSVVRLTSRWNRRIHRSRNRYCKRRTLVYRSKFNITAVGLEQRTHDPQAETRTSLFSMGCEKRRKNILRVSRRDTRTVIGDSHAENTFALVDRNIRMIRAVLAAVIA